MAGPSGHVDPPRDSAVRPNPTVRLNNGVTIPQIGLGVFQVPAAEVQRVTEVALSVGYRHIDTAAAYNNEQGVGHAIRASGLPRDQLFVTSKLRNGDQGHQAACRAYTESCDRLRLDQLDLYLIHWLNPVADLYIQSWQALERIYLQNEVRSIGVSNFTGSHLRRLLERADVVPVVNQIELHPSFQQRSIVSTSQGLGIAVEAYSPLGQGQDLRLQPVTRIARSSGRTPAQVILRWHLQHGHIVIPKSRKPDRIAENISLVNDPLSEDDMRDLDGVQAGMRVGNDPATFGLSQIR